MNNFSKPLLLVSALAIVGVTAHAAPVYNSIDPVLAPGYPSQPFQAQQTFEFGDRVTLGGTERDLTTVSVTMVNWARYEDYNLGGQYYGTGQWAGNGFNHNLTLKIYDAGTGLNHGALLGSLTESKFIAYRPTGWATNGYAQNVTFDFTSLNITLPNSIVWGISFDTQSYGTNPLGVDGPYNSLNVGLNTAVGGGITAGSTDLDRVFWNTTTGAWYTDGGAGGVGIFREDWGWTGYNPMAQINAVPEPTTMAALGLGAFAAIRRRKKTAQK
jgi:hypothetical protein